MSEHQNSVCGEEKGVYKGLGPEEKLRAYDVKITADGENTRRSIDFLDFNSSRAATLGVLKVL